MSTRAEALARLADREPGEALDLRGVDLRGAHLYGANLYEANLYGANLSWANLSGVDLYGVDLSGADLSGADLRGADLRGANLYGANLWGANLRGADLRGVNLRGTNLYRSNLTGARWDGLRVDGPPSGQVTLTPTPDGWHLHVDCWGDVEISTVDDLRALVAGEDWPGADTAEERARRRPGLLALADLCDAHAAAHADVIVDLAARWGTDAEVAR